MKTYALRIPDYASEDLSVVEILVSAESEADARRIANEQYSPLFWDGADCHEIKNPPGVTIVVGRSHLK